MLKKINALMYLADLTGAKPLAWPALFAILLATGLASYLPYHQANFWLGILAITLFTRFPVAEKGGYRFLLASVFFLGLYILFPVKTLFFFTLVSALLFSLESITGKLPLAIVPVVFLMSPVANYLVEIFSYPAMLQLSNWAAYLLQLTGDKAKAVGNSIFFKGQQLDVDHAAIGLSMLLSSLLMGLISIQLFEAKYHRRLPLPYLPLVLVYFIVFNLAANLIRIIYMVYFRVEPDTNSHLLTGLACWIILGIVPSMVLVKAMVKHIGRYDSVKPVVTFKQPGLPFYQVTQLGLLLSLSFVFGLPPETEEKNVEASVTVVPAKGYEYQLLPHNVSLLKNESSLIYIKPIGGFLSMDHNPASCWKGSGYTFTKVRNAKRGSALMYMANLEKEGDILYTAWWYERGHKRTNNQLIWRWQNLKKGHDYRLVNITASSRDDLECAIENWIHDKDAVVSLQP